MSVNLDFESVIKFDDTSVCRVKPLPRRRAPLVSKPKDHTQQRSRSTLTWLQDFEVDDSDWFSVKHRPLPVL